MTPRRARSFFEALVADNVGIGRPEEVSIVFAGRQVRKRRGERFQTRIFSSGTRPQPVKLDPSLGLALLTPGVAPYSPKARICAHFQQLLILNPAAHIDNVLSIARRKRGARTRLLSIAVDFAALPSQAAALRGQPQPSATSTPASGQRCRLNGG